MATLNNQMVPKKRKLWLASPAQLNHVQNKTITLNCHSKTSVPMATLNMPSEDIFSLIVVLFCFWQKITN